MCVGLAAGCCASIALSLGCATCTTVGSVVSKATRFSYALLMLIATLIAVVMLTDSLKSWILQTFRAAWSLPEVECDGLGCFSPDKLQEQAQNAVLNETITSGGQYLESNLERVVGALAVNRVMLGVAIFHGIMALALVGVANSGDPRAKLQNDIWVVKVAVYLGLVAWMFWLDTAYFDNVTILFKFGACLFIFIQLTMLIDGAYNSFDFLVERIEVPAWKCVTVCSTLCMYGFCLFVFIATVVKHSREDDGCNEGIWAVMLGFLLMIVVTVLSISPFVRDADNGAGATNGVFQSGMVSAYSFYYVFSAMINHPEERCHLVDINHGSTSVKFLGLVATFVAVLWSAVRNGSHTEDGDTDSVGTGTFSKKPQWLAARSWPNAVGQTFAAATKVLPRCSNMALQVALGRTRTMRREAALN